ncbi:MAG: carboxymuconolactone decarboxylase family protein [Ferrovibrio sp.]|nr:carboxymuconolactone decarboxylase family protein [Ferrovibrio sp.]MCW0233787.1 carboxymuconolactone decarboxylase family protein [Ferrovibrio sp.]
MLDWNDYRRQLKSTTGDLGKLSPGTMDGYRAMATAYKDSGHLDAKMRELMSIAVAVALRCDGCITVHTDAAIRHGATREEIAEACNVAISISAGAAVVYSARVLDAHAMHPSVAKPAT